MTESRLRLEVLKWFANGEIGLSSECIALTLCGVQAGAQHPLDPDDFRRCLLLLEAIPALRRRFHRLRKLSAVWRRLVDNWDELEKMVREEMAAGDMAPRSYKFMKKLGT